MPVNYVNNSENVLAILYPSGNLGFNTQADSRLAAQRSVCFAMGAASPSFPAEAAGCWSIGEVMQVAMPDLTTIQGMTAVGETAQKQVRFDWTVGNDRYRLGHGTDMNTDDVADAPPVLVTCIGAANSRCTSWTVVPQGPAALFRAELSTGKGGKLVVGPNEYVGHYDMPFVQTLTLK